MFDQIFSALGFITALAFAGALLLAGAVGYGMGAADAQDEFERGTREGP